MMGGEGWRDVCEGREEGDEEGGGRREGGGGGGERRKKRRDGWVYVREMSCDLLHKENVQEHFVNADF